MKLRMLCSTLLLSFSAGAHAATVNLEGDIGCDSIEVQQHRVQLTRIIMTTDNEQTKDRVTRQILALTGEHCTALTGIFKIEGRAPGLIKVVTKEGVALWLVE